MKRFLLKKRVGGIRTGDFVSLFSFPSPPTKYIADISDSINQKIENAISLIKENNIVRSVAISVDDSDNCYLSLEFNDGTNLSHATSFSLVVLPKKIAIRFKFTKDKFNNTVTAEYDY
jgi:hypothetical protein